MGGFCAAVTATISEGGAFSPQHHLRDCHHVRPLLLKQQVSIKVCFPNPLCLHPHLIHLRMRHVCDRLLMLPRLDTPSVTSFKTNLPCHLLQQAPSEQWLTALISASQPQLGSFAPQSLVSVLDACAKLKFQPSPDWMCESLVVLQVWGGRAHRSTPRSDAIILDRGPGQGAWHCIYVPVVGYALCPDPAAHVNVSKGGAH